jgi:hypothetical protein
MAIDAMRTEYYVNSDSLNFAIFEIDGIFISDLQVFIEILGAHMVQSGLAALRQFRLRPECKAN